MVRTFSLTICNSSESFHIGSLTKSDPPALPVIGSSSVGGLPVAGLSAGGSSAAGSHITNMDEPPKIWSYIRNLQGIIGVLYQPLVPVVPRPQESASLGVLAENYLQAHGYTQSAINSIASTARSSPSAEGFVDSLIAYGLTRTEAKFLWDIIEWKTEVDMVSR